MDLFSYLGVEDLHVSSCKIWRGKGGWVHQCMRVWLVVGGWVGGMEVLWF